MATIFESNCLKVPAAAFRGFANIISPIFSLSALIFSNTFIDKKASPLTSTNKGGLSTLSFKGILLIVLTF